MHVAVPLLGEKLLSSLRQRDVYFCARRCVVHALLPPTPTLVHFLRVYICLLKPVCFSFRVRHAARGLGRSPPRLTLANAPTLSHYCSAEYTHSMWYRELDQTPPPPKKKTMMLYHPDNKTQWPSADTVSALLPLARQWMWRMRGMCELWELRGRANFQGPYITCVH